MMSLLSHGSEVSTRQRKSLGGYLCRQGPVRGRDGEEEEEGQGMMGGRGREERKEWEGRGKGKKEGRGLTNKVSY